MRKSWLLLSVLLLVVIVPVAFYVTAGNVSQELSGVVRVGSWDSGEALEPFNTAIAQFEEMYPDVDVQLEAVPQEYGTKLLAQFAAGDAPDVFQTGDGDVSKFQRLGAVENLDPYISGEVGDNPLDMGVFFPGVAAFGQIEGSTYYLTKDYSPLVIYYNKDHFDEAGLEYPTSDWTLEDMLNTAMLLTLDGDGNNAASEDFDSGDIERWGLQIPDAWGDPLWLRGILPLIYANGGTLVSEDGMTTDGHMNGEKTVAALEWYVSLFQDHFVAPSREDVAAFAGVDMFQSGLVSILWNGRWPLKDFIANPDLNFGTVGLPAGAEGNANVLCWAGFAMYTGGDNKDAAWAFLKHIAAEEGAEAFAEYAFTAVQSIADSQGLSEDEYNAPIIADLANVKPLPEALTPFWGECGETIFRTHLETVFLEGLSVQEAMDNAVEEADACFAEKAES